MGVEGGEGGGGGEGEGRNGEEGEREGRGKGGERVEARFSQVKVETALLLHM